MRSDQSSSWQVAGMTHALVTVLQFVETVLHDDSPELSYPLIQLLARLADISSGVPVSEFKIETPHRPRDGIRLASFKRNCAEALSLYMRNGMRKKDAAQRIATHLTPLDNIKPRTICDWRDSLEETSVKDPAGKQYQLTITGSDPLTNDEIDTQVKRLCTEFAGLKTRAQPNRVEHKKRRHSSARSD